MSEGWPIERLEELRQQYVASNNSRAATVAYINGLHHELRQRLALSETKGWIPVGERMPERYRPVLVAAREGHPQRQLFVPKGLLAWNGDRWCLGVNDTAYSSEVTHWMPLPEAPHG
jgi:hypothetical protein